jgi:hypothetical protein
MRMASQDLPINEKEDGSLFRVASCRAAPIPASITAVSRPLQAFPRVRAGFLNADVG